MKSKGVKEKVRRVEGNNNDFNKEQGVIRKSHRRRTMVAAFVPLVVLAIMIFLMFSPTFQQFINTGIPLPEVAIENIQFQKPQVKL